MDSAATSSPVSTPLVRVWRRVEDLRRRGVAVSAERDRLQEELTEAQERLTAQAAQLLQAHEDVVKEQAENRQVRL